MKKMKRVLVAGFLGVSYLLASSVHAKKIKSSDTSSAKTKSASGAAKKRFGWFGKKTGSDSTKKFDYKKQKRAIEQELKLKKGVDIKKRGFFKKSYDKIKSAPQALKERFTKKPISTKAKEEKVVGLGKRVMKDAPDIAKKKPAEAKKSWKERFAGGLSELKKKLGLSPKEKIVKKESQTKEKQTDDGLLTKKEEKFETKDKVIVKTTETKETDAGTVITERTVLKKKPKKSFKDIISDIGSRLKGIGRPKKMSPAEERRRKMQEGQDALRSKRAQQDEKALDMRMKRSPEQKKVDDIVTMKAKELEYDEAIAKAVEEGRPAMAADLIKEQKQLKEKRIEDEDALRRDAQK